MIFILRGGGGDFAEFLNFLKETPYEFVKVKFRNDGYKHIKSKIYLCEKRFSFGAFAYYIKPSGALKWLKNLKKDVLSHRFLYRYVLYSQGYELYLDR
ncbi:hypothetical protein ACBE48_001112 [Campylobacter upsaliensis]